MNNAVSVSAVNRRHMRSNPSREIECECHIGGEYIASLITSPVLGWSV